MELRLLKTVAFICVLAVSLAGAETLYLKDGRVITGEILKASSQKIDIKTETVTLSIPVNEIDRMSEKDDLAESEEDSKAEKKSLRITVRETPEIVASPVPKSEKKDITKITSGELRQIFQEVLEQQMQMQAVPIQKRLEQKESASSEAGHEEALPALSQIAEEKQSAVAEQPEGEEFRGIWVTRFEWVSKDPATCKTKIVNILDRIKEANFNAVILQVRGQGDVLYCSTIEPWSPLAGAKDPGFDPLLFAIEEAHKRGLQLHAAINLYPVWQGENPPAAVAPVHPFLLHCQPLSLLNWLACDTSRMPMECSSSYNKYYWLSPGIPEVQAYLRKVVADVVQRYDVDGIHLDRARYPGREFSHDKVSIKRFDGAGNPDHLDWEDWQRRQVDNLIHDIYAEIRMAKPDVCFSAAVWGIYNRLAIPGYVNFSGGWNDYYQDSRAWLREGYIDAIMPMIYWNIHATRPHFDELAKDFINNANGKNVFPLISPSNASKDWEEEIDLTRKLGSQGMAIFSYSALTKGELWEKLREKTFVKPARVPQLVKKDSKLAIITGHVYSVETRKPVEDCIVEVRETTHRALSSGDGFYAILDVEPGRDISILAHREDTGSAIVSGISVSAGESKRVDITITK
jgi:uncharacterized lipoprotein YddW (UPF0748 family)